MGGTVVNEVTPIDRRNYCSANICGCFCEQFKAPFLVEENTLIIPF
jgi:hypothetical protein